MQFNEGAEYVQLVLQKQEETRARKLEYARSCGADPAVDRDLEERKRGANRVKKGSIQFESKGNKSMRTISLRSRYLNKSMNN